MNNTSAARWTRTAGTGGNAVLSSATVSAPLVGFDQSWCDECMRVQRKPWPIYTVFMYGEHRCGKCLRTLRTADARSVRLPKEKV